MPAVAQTAMTGNTGFLTQQPETYRIIAINVEGITDENTRYLVIRQSGLEEGQEVLIPYDEAFGKAIRQLYRFGLFSDVEIVVERFVDDGVYLLIKVKEEPRLRDYIFSGSKGGHNDDLTRAVASSPGAGRSIR